MESRRNVRETNTLSSRQRRTPWNRRHAAWQRSSNRPDNSEREPTRGLVAAATGNRQADASVPTRITWHAGGDAVRATASTWHHKCDGMPNGSVIMERDGKHMGRGRCAMEAAASIKASSADSLTSTAMSRRSSPSGRASLRSRPAVKDTKTRLTTKVTTSTS